MGDAKGNNAEGEGKGTGRAAFKGIVFVEQVALTYPLAHLINQHFSKSSSRGSGMNGDSQCATCLKPKAAVEFEEPTALPVSGTGSMVDAVRYWLSEGIIQQLMAKARELEKNADVKCKRLAERIFSGVEHVRTNVNS